MNELNRRRFLKIAGVQGAALGMTSAGLWLPGSALAQEGALRWANLSPGFTVMITSYVQAKGLDKKHGLNLGKPTSYTSVSTYYSDFIAGNMDVCIGSWDTFAARYLAGVPMEFVCAFTTANMINIVVPADGAESIQDLKGKMLAAPQSTGTYRMTRAVLKELEKFDVESDMRVQNVDNPAASVTLVMANRADAGLSWEPNISVGLSKVPDMRVVYNVGKEYAKKVGLDLPFFGVAIRKELAERDPSIPGKVDRMLADCIVGMTGDLDEAVEIAGAGSGIPPDVFKAAIRSNRLEFKHISMANEKGRESIKKASGFLARNKFLPRIVDDGFFYKS